MLTQIEGGVLALNIGIRALPTAVMIQPDRIAHRYRPFLAITMPMIAARGPIVSVQGSVATALATGDILFAAWK
jgi:hypothetical protein